MFWLKNKKTNRYSLLSGGLKCITFNFFVGLSSSMLNSTFTAGSLTLYLHCPESLNLVPLDPTGLVFLTLISTAVMPVIYSASRYRQKVPHLKCLRQDT